MFEKIFPNIDNAGIGHLCLSSKKIFQQTLAYYGKVQRLIIDGSATREFLCCVSKVKNMKEILVLADCGFTKICLINQFIDQLRKLVVECPLYPYTFGKPYSSTLKHLALTVQPGGLDLTMLVSLEELIVIPMHKSHLNHIWLPESLVTAYLELYDADDVSFIRPADKCVLSLKFTRLSCNNVLDLLSSVAQLKLSLYEVVGFCTYKEHESPYTDYCENRHIREIMDRGRPKKKNN